MTKFFETPFAQAGNKTAVPDALQPDGSISYTEGWSADYELPNTDPDYKPIGREHTNQMFFDITEAMGLVQREGILFWDTTFAYSQHARVIGSDGQVYKAVIANTGNDPTTDLGTNWVLDSQVVLASQEEAENGVDNEKYMSPLRVAQARGVTGQWSQGLADFGWQKMPSGLILQWGEYSASTVFPIAFTEDCYVVFAQDYDSSATPTSIASKSATGFTLYSPETATGYYLAIGR